MDNRLYPYQDQIRRKYQDHPLVKAGKQLTYDITFQVTDACNLRCKYCYQINKQNHFLNFETAKKFIDLLLDPPNETTKTYIDSRNSLACIINFIGGEPLLAIDLIDEITEYFKKRVVEVNHPWQYNYLISIISNGVLYFNPKVQEYLQKNLEHITFAVSIDGNKQVHDACRVFPDGSGSYDLAIAAARDWQNNKHQLLGNKITISPDTVQYVKDAVINLINEKYHYIHINCTYESHWTIEHAKIYYHQLIELADYILMNGIEDQPFVTLFLEHIGQPKKLSDIDHQCNDKQQGMVAVDWRGIIYPCIRFMDSSLGDNIPPLIIGNVNDGICVTPQEQNCVKCMWNTNRLTISDEKCIKCPVAEGCSYCQAFNYQDNNGHFGHRATYHCIMHKALVLANCYFWNLRYWKYNEEKRFKLWLPDEEALQIISKEELQFLKQLQYPLDTDNQTTKDLVAKSFELQKQL